MRKITVICLSLILLVSPLFLGLAAGDYTAHDPFRIDSDTEFSNIVSTNGWTGSGTSSDPFIIQGLEIDGSTAGYGIYIGNTTVYFSITGCKIHNVTDTGNSDDYFNSGITLYSVANAVITENTLADNANGIRLIKSSSNYIYHNNFISNTVQAFDDGTNNWDNGYPAGGNYWSDWTSPDSNSDGFVDTAYEIPGQGPASNGELTIIFIKDDYGNGEGTIIISPDGYAMLYDAGSTGNGAKIIGILDDYGISKLTHTVASHYHEDHIGAMDEVILGLGGSSYAVTGYCYDRGYSYGGAFPEYLDAVGSKRHQISKWEVINLGSYVTLTCVGLNGNGETNLKGENEYGVVLRLDYGEFNLYLGGDIGGYDDSYHNDIESTVANDIGQVEVYQVDHHGSAHSSNSYFLGILNPQISVFSCSDWNPYGHPTYDTYYRVKDQGSYMYWTSAGAGAPLLSGDGKVVDDNILLTTDGQSYTVGNEAGTISDDYDCYEASPAGSEVDSWPFVKADGWITQTPSTKPLEPLNLAAEGLTDKISLTWNPPNSDGGSSITGYNVYRNNGTSASTLIAELGNVTSYEDTDIVDGQTYYYHVTAVNENGEGRESEEASATASSLPSAPLNLQATGGSGKVVLDWSPPAENGGSPIITYRIYKNTASVDMQFLTSVGQVETFTDYEVENGVTYYYKICATNENGYGDYTGIVQATPSAGSNVPSAPQNFVVQQKGKSAKLTWEAPVSDGHVIVMEYHVYRAVGSSEFELLEIVDGQSFEDGPLELNTTYLYKVSAVNTVGEGASSPIEPFIIDPQLIEETDPAAYSSKVYVWLIVIVVILTVAALVVKALPENNPPEPVKPVEKKPQAPKIVKQVDRHGNKFEHDLSNIPPTEWER